MKETTYTYPKGSVELNIQENISKILEVDSYIIKISMTQDKKFGDLTTSIAMSLAKERRENPFDIANKIKEGIGNIKGVSRIEVIKPGFVNFFVSNELIREELLAIDENFGKSDEHKDSQIMVEYGQPNTHKTITVGHVKSAITGLAVARLYENVGYDVVHANYFGDFGPYVAKTLYALFLKVKQDFSISDLNDENVNKAVAYIEDIKEKEGLKGVMSLISELYAQATKLCEDEDGLTGVIKDINNLLFENGSKPLNKIYKYTRELCIQFQDQFFGDLGVKYDRQYPESEVSENGKKIVKENIGKVFIEDKGAVIFPGEKYKMSRYVFLTEQGNPTYSGKDLGLAVLKFKEYPKLEFSLVLTSVEQNDYFNVLIKVLELIFPEIGKKYRHIGFGWLLFGNKKTSARKGDKAFTYDVMINEAITIAKEKISALKEYSKDDIDNISKKIAIAGFKFNILSRELHKDINYDPNTFMSLSGFSAPYIMYSYARAVAILSKGKVEKLTAVELGKVFNEKVEIDLIKKLLEYPNIVKTSANILATHILCNYLYELADTFNSFYTTCPILNFEDELIKKSRLVLLEKTTTILKNGFYILGIETVDKM
ncbi:arginine--tRNA ligase [Candidatus Dojkabacteria bacterium]|jgi:arginyl-tRNA synthetase|nr:arginine--tRNA ligase [Candidatus Dojkabacteria bacterium]